MPSSHKNVTILLAFFFIGRNSLIYVNIGAAQDILPTFECSHLWTLIFTINNFHCGVNLFKAFLIGTFEFSCNFVVSLFPQNFTPIWLDRIAPPRATYAYVDVPHVRLRVTYVLVMCVYVYVRALSVGRPTVCLPWLTVFTFTSLYIDLQPLIRPFSTSLCFPRKGELSAVRVLDQTWHLLSSMEVWKKE